MNKVENIIKQMKGQWGKPSLAIHRGEEIPFKLACSFNEANNVISNDFKIPDEMLDFYHVSNGASLFQDKEYGQWGLSILSITNSFLKTEEYVLDRKNDVLEGDLIIGEFLGDSELLLLRCNLTKEDYGNIIVVSPIEKRKYWCIVSLDFEKFLSDYFTSQGDKYWEV